MAEEGTNHLVRELADHRASELIEDGDKRFITCSSCREELVEIWIVRPDAPLTTEMIVQCPFCGDQSFKQVIRGQYCLGHLESRAVILVDTPTTTETTKDGKLLQKILVKTVKGDI